MRTQSLSILLLAALTSLAPAQIADHVVREKIAGMDVLACKTGVKDVVTLRGSLPAGDSFAPANNLAIPTLAGEMLDQGTTQHDKFAIAQQLEAVGARIDFSVGGVMTEFSGKCLRKDLPLVISLLAEELRTPSFPEEEFAKLKKQIAGDLRRALESPDFRAEQAFAEAIYPKGHPNYAPPVKDFLDAVDAAQIEEVKAFHATCYGPADATLVAVGDVEIESLKAAVAEAFVGWSGGQRSPASFPQASAPTTSHEAAIPMPDKPNVTVILGQASGLRYRDPDALALRLATAVLGHGFTGRLMANVRDKEGLTYGIEASTGKDTFADGEWRMEANFAPDLLEKGMESTKRELDSWYAHGITAAELERVKSAAIGTFEVGLTTTDGLSNALLDAIHRGYDVHWLDEYPARVKAVKLEQANAALKKYLQPANMVVIEAGDLPPATPGD
ncbi:MAG: M16 family metallopeptidase [Chthoniobacterales bacterium]